MNKHTEQKLEAVTKRTEKDINKVVNRIYPKYINGFTGNYVTDKQPSREDLRNELESIFSNFMHNLKAEGFVISLKDAEQEPQND